MLHITLKFIKKLFEHFSNSRMNTQQDGKLEKFVSVERLAFVRRK